MNSPIIAPDGKTINWPNAISTTLDKGNNGYSDSTVSTEGVDMFLGRRTDYLQAPLVTSMASGVFQGTCPL